MTYPPPAPIAFPLVFSSDSDDGAAAPVVSRLARASARLSRLVVAKTMPQTPAARRSTSSAGLRRPLPGAVVDVILPTRAALARR